MGSLWKAKKKLGIFFTTLFIMLSYEVKNPLLPGYQWLLVIISFTISSYLADFIVEYMMNFRHGRAFILGKSWIEGYWYLKTSISDHAHDISNDGIVFITYEGSDHELNVFTYRTKTDSLDSGFSSVSELVTARDYDTKFSNYFVIPEGHKSTHGITVGKFFCNGDSRYLNRFEGTVVLFGDGLYRRQVANKIEFSLIKRLRKEHGDNWKDYLLKHLKERSFIEKDE
jgi:hypothetical protein